jgi:hypothetical protein
MPLIEIGSNFRFWSSNHGLCSSCRVLYKLFIVVGIAAAAPGSAHTSVSDNIHLITEIVDRAAVLLVK